MAKLNYQEKLASNVHREVRTMLRKRQLSEMRKFEEEQRLAEEAAQVDHTRMQLREKFWLGIVKFCKMDDLLREIEARQHKTKTENITR